MASVLGTSRGSGGLSGQLRCKSKRRRRRRSKRKGKDLAFCAASTNCTLLCLARVVPPLQQLRCGVLGGVRSKQSAQESRSLCKGPGGFFELRGDCAQRTRQLRAQPSRAASSRGAGQAGTKDGAAVPWSAARSPPWSPPWLALRSPALPLTLSEATLARGAKGNTHLSQQPQKQGQDPVPAPPSKLSRRKEWAQPRPSRFQIGPQFLLSLVGTRCSINTRTRGKHGLVPGVGGGGG
ncbi:hypothetical protein VULLAG_LOCUS23236 [Vulpes lagopus]